MSTFTSTTSGIVLSSTSQNPATIASGAYITNTTGAHSGDAIYGSTATAWDIVNLGTIASTKNNSKGIDLRNGGTVTNASTARIDGVVNGIFITGGAGTVANSGTIGGTGASGEGIFLAAGGNITNYASGL